MTQPHILRKLKKIILGLLLSLKLAGLNLPGRWARMCDTKLPGQVARYLLRLGSDLCHFPARGTSRDNDGLQRRGRRKPHWAVFYHVRFVI